VPTATPSVVAVVILVSDTPKVVRGHHPVRDLYILEAARSSGFPLLALDGLIRSNAKKLGLSLVELDL
jgi:hypothetical protein